MRPEPSISFRAWDTNLDTPTPSPSGELVNCTMTLLLPPSLLSLIKNARFKGS